MKLITKMGDDMWMVYEDEDLGTPESNLKRLKRLGVYSLYTLVVLGGGMLFLALINM